MIGRSTMYLQFMFWQCMLPEFSPTSAFLLLLLLLLLFLFLFLLLLLLLFFFLLLLLLQDCGLEHLEDCARVSSGTINTLNPLELNRQIRQLAQNPVVATDVQLTIRLPRGFAFEHAAQVANRWGTEKKKKKKEKN